MLFSTLQTSISGTFASGKSRKLSSLDMVNCRQAEVDLAWTPSIAIRHLSAELMSSDEIKKCHPETRQVKRNF